MFNDCADALAQGALVDAAEHSKWEIEGIFAFVSSLSAVACQPLLFCTFDGAHDASEVLLAVCACASRIGGAGKAVVSLKYEIEFLLQIHIRRRKQVCRALEASIQLVQHELYKCRDLAVQREVILTKLGRCCLRANYVFRSRFLFPRSRWVYVGNLQMVAFMCSVKMSIET